MKPTICTKTIVLTFTAVLVYMYMYMYQYAVLTTYTVHVHTMYCVDVYTPTFGDEVLSTVRVPTETRHVNG